MSRPGSVWLRRAATAALPTAVLLWIVALLHHVRLDRMGGYGLITVLPVTYWAGLVVLTLGFALALRTPRLHGAWYASYVVALIAMLQATPAVLYPSLRYSWAWKHVAVVDYLLRHGATDPTNGDLGVYHQWPGFFAVNAVFAHLAGTGSAASYAAWGPLVNNLLLIGPLVLIYRSFTRDRRLIWAAVWIYFSCAWVGQDYFSPQAFALVLYLSLIAIILSRLHHRAADPADAEAARVSDVGFAVAALRGRPSRRGAATWTLLLLPIIAAIASSHQLTPVMLICAMGILAASRRRWRTVLPLFLAAAVFAVAWAATIARPFIQANLNSILKSFGKLDANASSRLESQATASHEQQLIAHVETGMAAVVWLLALVALVKWRGLRRSPAVLLALAPLPLLAANDYGGEIVFRIYLFALPATAFMVAALLWRSRRRPWVQALGFPLALLAMLGGFVLGYYGKERMNYFSPSEVAASQALFRVAPHGSVIVGATSAYPGIYTDYENYTTLVWLTGLTARQQRAVAADPAGALVAELRNAPRRPVYFILTRAEEAEIEISGLLPPQGLARLEQLPGQTPELKVIYRNQDAVVMELSSPPPPQPQPPPPQQPAQPAPGGVRK
jgi:hypothetical protein